MVAKIKKILSLILCASLVFPTYACSAFRSSTQLLTVTVDQRDAEIYINGVLAGKGTANLAVKRDQNVSLLVKKEGYIPVQRTIGKSLNTTGVLDIIGGALILLPLFGLLAAGAYSLDEANVTIVMVEK